MILALERSSTKEHLIVSSEAVIVQDARLVGILGGSGTLNLFAIDISY